MPRLTQLQLQLAKQFNKFALSVDPFGSERRQTLARIQKDIDKESEAKAKRKEKAKEDAEKKAKKTTKTA